MPCHRYSSLRHSPHLRVIDLPFIDLLLRGQQQVMSSVRSAQDSGINGKGHHPVLSCPCRHYWRLLEERLGVWEVSASGELTLPNPKPIAALHDMGCSAAMGPCNPRMVGMALRPPLLLTVLDKGRDCHRTSISWSAAPSPSLLPYMGAPVGNL